MFFRANDWWKETGFSNPNSFRMSSLALAVAVAVKAKKGTLGNAVFKSDIFK